MQFIPNITGLGKSIEETEGTTVLVSGDQGMGKTVLAITVCCYYNAGKDHPCTYTASPGLKPRFIGWMKSSNIGFVMVEKKGLFYLYMSSLVVSHDLVNNF